MNLNWNPTQFRWEVEFHNFPVEQPLVKAAGFKTDGPPAWVWYSTKAAPLTKLRESKGSTVLTISPDARTQYTRLKEIEDKNAATKASFTKAKKAVKSDAIKPDEYLTPEGFVCMRVEGKDICLAQPFVRPPARPDQKTCIICKDPIYFYEKQTPPTCLWCEIKVLDNPGDVC